MKPAADDLNHRRIAWEALSDLYLETDTSLLRDWRVERLLETPYTTEERRGRLLRDKSLAQEVMGGGENPILHDSHTPPTRPASSGLQGFDHGGDDLFHAHAGHAVVVAEGAFPLEAGAARHMMAQDVVLISDRPCE